MSSGETMKAGQIWRTPGPLGEETLLILAPPFEWAGEEYVAVKKAGSIAPCCARVEWIRAGGKRDPTLEEIDAL